ncbi:hypothetical protein D3C72_1040170 [compost metagenome]
MLAVQPLVDHTASFRVHGVERAVGGIGVAQIAQHSIAFPEREITIDQCRNKAGRVFAPIVVFFKPAEDVPDIDPLVVKAQLVHKPDDFHDIAGFHVAKQRAWHVCVLCGMKFEILYKYRQTICQSAKIILTDCLTICTFGFT